MFDSKKYKEENKDKIKKYQLSWRNNNPQYQTEWKNNNPGYFKSYSKDYYSNKNNKETQRRQQREWAKRNRKKVLEYRKQTIPKIITSMRSNLHRILKYTNVNKFNKTIEYFGCTPTELKEYLEKQFKPGMTWDNWSKDGWHVDHIKPLSSFTEENIMQANHYTNLQPLWAKENLSKGDKVLNNNINE